MKQLLSLRDGEHVSGIYLCKAKLAAKTKTGKTYYSLTLMDKSGTADGKIWDLSSGIDNFEAMDYIDIEGDVTVFQGVNQLNIRRVRRAREGEYDPADYLPASRYTVSSMTEELTRLIGTVRSPHIKALLEKFFVEDKAFFAEFCRHSAAKSIHHGFVGGLLEHTVSVAVLCDFYARRYSLLNRDLLVAAALLHDIGKVRELSVFPENDYTDEGQLIGHIVIGVEMVDEKLRSLPDFPPVIASEIKHCILAHHGEYEFGSPKKPALPEALALSMADNTDAKLELMRETFLGTEGTEWLAYQKLFESRLRKSTEYKK